MKNKTDQPTKPAKATNKANGKTNVFSRMTSWVKRHKADTTILTALVVISGLVSGMNMANYPQRFEDEGTYVSQAWAVKEQAELAHYTYWYDHPPLAWIQLAGYNALTGAESRYGSAVSAGREFMLVLHLATIVLLYALARRLGIGAVIAAAATLLYVLSPLAVEFSRYVLLDNIALPWLLGAFLLALSPRRHLVTVVGSALCMTIAVLSKETFLAFLPALIYALFQASDKRNRRFMLTAFITVFSLTVGFYALYAVLKNELLPGPGHVSLLGTLIWQISGREGTGSIFDETSGTRGLVEYWLNIDAWLIVAGSIATVVALFRRNLRPIALAMLIGLALLLRTGYLPFPYIIVLLPFAALMIAGALQILIGSPLQSRLTGRLHLTKRWLAGITGIVLTVATVAVLTPAWQPKLNVLLTTDVDAPSRQAVDWVDQNISRDSRLIVESALWSDIERQGFENPQPVWIYKTETDPEVTRELNGWQNIDYVVLNGPTLTNDVRGKFPTVSQAIDNATVVAEFGDSEHKVVIMRVNKN